jgi:purine-binding chemotaxis protein CheW
MHNTSPLHLPDIQQQIVFNISDQKYGLKVKYIEDIIAKYTYIQIPGAPKNILGALNLKNKIVIALDPSLILEANYPSITSTNFGIVISHNSALYCLVVNHIYNILDLQSNNIKPLPLDMSHPHKEIFSGICNEYEDSIFLLDKDKLFAKCLSN